MKIITDNGFVIYEVPLKLMVKLESSFTSFHDSSVVTTPSGNCGASVRWRSRVSVNVGRCRVGGHVFA